MRNWQTHTHHTNAEDGTSQFLKSRVIIEKILIHKNLSIFSSFHRRFQNYYATNKSITTPSSSYSRPQLSAHHPIPPDAPVTSLPPSAPPGFLQPPPVMRINKQPELPTNRLQQTPSSIGMGHPTFRSEFNVNLRYFMFFLFYFFSSWFSTVHLNFLVAKLSLFFEVI